MRDSALPLNLLGAREANYQKPRIRQGLRPGSQFERQPPTAQRNSHALASTVNIVVELRETFRSEDTALQLAEEGPADLAMTGEAGEDA